MAEWEAENIHDVIIDIRDRKIVLPVIQRNLVWDEERMELLFDSLLRGNSFGGIMALEEEKGSQPLFAFRQFSKDGELHDSDLPPVLDQTIMLIIDGQQRLQTFYMGLMGSTNGKTLFFNLYSQGEYEFEFSQSENELPVLKTEEEQDIALLWYPASMLFYRLERVGNSALVAKEIINTRNIQDEKFKELIKQNVLDFQMAIFVSKVLGISKVFVNRENVIAERRRMVELFRRLNSGGTVLSALDLAASMLKGFDFRLESFLRRDIPQFSDIGFGQDEVIKLLFLLQDNHTKEVTDISKEDADFAIKNTSRILKALEVLRQLLVDAGLFEYYRNGGRSAIPLYFVAYHIFHKAESTDALSTLYANFDTNNPEFTNIKRWLYLSLLNGVFSRGKGWVPYITGVRKILNIISHYKGQLFPTEELLSMYESYPLIFSRELNETQLSHWDINFAFYLMYDRHNLSGRDIDHIQPKSILEQAKISAEKIHSLSNYQLLDEGTNRGEKRAKILNEWLKGWKEAELKPYLERHLIPKDSNLWLLENFDTLLYQRSKKILEKIKQVIPQQSVASIKNQNAPKQIGHTTSQINGAVWLTKEERDPEVWLTGLADQKGYGQEFRKIVEAARLAGLNARFQNNWWVVKFTPIKNHNQGLFLVGADLALWINTPEIAAFLECPKAVVIEKLDFGKFIAPQDVPLWIENLHSLFSERN